MKFVKYVNSIYAHFILVLYINKLMSVIDDNQITRSNPIYRYKNDTTYRCTYKLYSHVSTGYENIQQMSIHCAHGIEMSIRW